MNTSRYSFGKRAIALCVLVTFHSLTMAQVVQNTTTSYQYDANGNLTQITDPLGRVTNQSYDALNRLKQQTLPVPATGVARPVINYTYDGQDQLATVTDPRNLTTQYTVDGLGNQTTLVSPDTGTAGNTYDEAGNLKTHTDARGKVTTYTYDALNRVTKIAYATGTATTFTYDGTTTGKGQLTQMTDESGTTTFGYNTRGRLNKKTQVMAGGTPTYVVTYAYSATTGSTNGHVISITYPSGNCILYGYDAAGRVRNIQYNPVNTNGVGTNTATTIILLRAINYSPFGLPNAWIWGNDTSTAPNTYARSIDLDGRITGYPLGNASNSGTYRTVNYDAASRITGTTHTGTGTGNAAPANFNQSFGYDGLDRVTSFAGGTASQGYSYDANGNRTSLTIGASSYTDTIAASSNKLTATNGPAPAETDTYDNAGNLTSDGSITYSYSDRGRMKSATAAGITTSYLYNGLNQRVSKASTAIATGANHYVYDEAGHLIGEYDATGKVIEETVYLGDTPVAILTQTVTGTAPNTTTTVNAYYIYADHLNAPRVITKASNNKMAWRWDNADPFGMSQPDQNPAGLGTFVYNQRFPGQLYDKETNLFYNINRDYDPQTGRYIESDPTGLNGGINTYAYVGGNPMTGFDPLGLANGMAPNNMVRDGTPSSPTAQAYAKAVGATILAGVTIYLSGPLVPVVGTVMGLEGAADGVPMVPGGRAAAEAVEAAEAAEAAAARDAAGQATGRQYATYAGGYANGEIAVGKSSNPVGCAEDDIVRQLGSNATMTKAYGWRRNPATGIVEWTEIPVCQRCQAKYSPNQFPSDVKAAPGGAWNR